MSDAARRCCGTIAILGAPNAGKSTLINRLVGSKVSIVSPKVQTTRARVLGIVLRGSSQLIFVDTPGIFAAPKRRLERAMVKAAWAGAADADLVLVLVDAARGLDPDSERLIAGLGAAGAAGRNPILALNKIDRVPREKLLPLAETLNAREKFARTFMISSLTGDGVEDLAQHLAALVPEGPWLFPEDQLSDVPLRLLAAELVREQVFLQLHEELPYAITVETEQWEEREDGSVRIDVTIHVARESHKPIVLGKGGAQVKRIGAAARHELEVLLERRVHLFLHVRVTADWSDDRARYDAIRLEWEK
ncbi:MAG TPA: GTPase Era [Stellaceae bacterium]|nr:GTPase Era [Stellaceae bacterium]